MTTTTRKTSRVTEAVIAMALAICSTAMRATGCSKQSNAQTADAHVDTTTSASEATMSPVKRGEYLVTIGGCNDCHTPMKMGANGPEPDMSRMLSGLPEDVKLTKPPKTDGACALSIRRVCLLNLRASIWRPSRKPPTRSAPCWCVVRR